MNLQYRWYPPCFTLNVVLLGIFFLFHNFGSSYGFDSKLPNSFSVFMQISILHSMISSWGFRFYQLALTWILSGNHAADMFCEVCIRDIAKLFWLLSNSRTDELSILHSKRHPKSRFCPNGGFIFSDISTITSCFCFWKCECKPWTHSFHDLSQLVIKT